MAEKTELETESKQSREAAAEMLRGIADEIGSGDEITIEGNSGSIAVPGAVEEIGTELEAEQQVKGQYDQATDEVELDWTIVDDGEDEA